jgi:mercuric ion transport protein
MPSIELVWDADCPNVEAARSNLAQALGVLGLPASWHEWQRDDPAAPEHARRAGSPAVLVEGQDVEGVVTGGDACCRIYVGADGKRSSAPAIESIVGALRRAGA